MPDTSALSCLAWNDGAQHHTMQLFGFKKVISQQLPMMPREYILRILLDRYHRCVLAIDIPNFDQQAFDRNPEMYLEKAIVLGGICFRPFHSQGFAEIVFLAVEEQQKHRGLGTQIMNHLKEHVKTEGIKYFLTYADNTAIGYFVKQGFTKKKTMVRPRWEGFIKDYVRSTLMECKILYNVNYVTFKKTLALQKAQVLKRIAKISKAHVIREPLDWESNQDEKFQIKDIPGVLEAGWVPDNCGMTKLWGLETSLTAQLGHILKVKYFFFFFF